jgi:hypothetical protein
LTVDLTAELGDRSLNEILTRGSHLNPEGSEIVASILDQAIRGLR